MCCWCKKKRVLIADDDSQTCLSLSNYLTRRGFDVVTAFDGRQAYEKIESESFDYCLLDLSMPELTGLELIGVARSKNLKAKIFLISGMPSVDQSLLRELGADRFIYKPLNVSEIEELLK